ncbi:MAG: hypothetical protein AAF800_10805 [Planctomycetota bacterium]
MSGGISDIGEQLAGLISDLVNSPDNAGLRRFEAGVGRLGIRRSEQVKFVNHATLIVADGATTDGLLRSMYGLMYTMFEIAQAEVAENDVPQRVQCPVQRWVALGIAGLGILLAAGACLLPENLNWEQSLILAGAAAFVSVVAVVVAFFRWWLGIGSGMIATGGAFAFRLDLNLLPWLDGEVWSGETVVSMTLIIGGLVLLLTMGVCELFRPTTR